MNMGLAVALVGMTSLAVAMLLLPLLLRNRAAASREAYNLAVYRDQLAEIDRDLDRGVLTIGQAEAARTEIGRRILALGAPTGPMPPSSAAPFAVAVGAIVILPFCAWSLYALLGSPAVPDQPFAERSAAGNVNVASGEANAPGNSSGSAAPHDMAEAIARLTAHLKEQPDDLNGWLLFARSQMSLGHFSEAASAYRKAADLSNDRADVIGDWGEALVLAANGKVTPEARKAFEKALPDPEDAPRSRYYLALADQQQGNVKGALQQWVDLEAETPADAEYLPMLRQRIAEAASGLGLDPATLKTSAGAARHTAPASLAQAAAPSQTAPAQAAASAPPAPAPDPQRVRETAQALAGASADDRQAMINAMVERLAARLEQQPNDVEGWTRLGRSYMVLNQPEKARDAYARAVKLNPDDPVLKQAYAEAAAAAGSGGAAPPSSGGNPARR
jgi:cytochrome c-type biogenesis protein CcmH